MEMVMVYSYFHSLYQMVRQALLLNESIFASMHYSAHGLQVALVIVLLAGVSEAFGQSIVLFINRVTPQRFGLALSISAISHVIGYLFWTATIWGIATFVFERTYSMNHVAAIVGLAYSPRLLSFFILTPFLGNMFSLLLSIWSLWVIIIAMRAGLDMSLWQAAATSGLGWLTIQVWYKTLGRPLYAVGQWLEHRAAGVPLLLTINDIAGLRRPIPQVWSEWLERLEQPQSSISDAQRAGGQFGPSQLARLANRSSESAG